MVGPVAGGLATMIGVGQLSYEKRCVYLRLCLPLVVDDCNIGRADGLCKELPVGPEDERAFSCSETAPDLDVQAITIRITSRTCCRSETSS
jgi:hypothetical protein